MSRWWRWLGAACLVGFPLGFIVFAGTGIHPGPSGTIQDQIRLVAAAEGRWRLVHLVLAAASLLGIGAMVTLWMMAVRGRSGILAWVGDLGAAAATSTADEPDPPAHRHCLLRRPLPQLGVGSVGGPGPQRTSRRCHGAELTATPILTTTPQSGTGSRSPRPPPARDAPRCGPS
jgi:hypothetical protein